MKTAPSKLRERGNELFGKCSFQLKAAYSQPDPSPDSISGSRERPISRGHTGSENRERVRVSKGKHMGLVCTCVCVLCLCTRGRTRERLKKFWILRNNSYRYVNRIQFSLSLLAKNNTGFHSLMIHGGALLSIDHSKSIISKA